MMRTVIELLCFEGCPGHERLLPVVQRLADEAGAELAVRVVDTDEAAHDLHFLGSPSVRVNGMDVEPGAHQRSDFGLKCRLYRTPEGQSTMPSEAWIRDALISPSSSATPWSSC